MKAEREIGEDGKGDYTKAFQDLEHTLGIGKSKDLELKKEHARGIIEAYQRAEEQEKGGTDNGRTENPGRVEDLRGTERRVQGSSGSTETDRKLSASEGQGAVGVNQVLHGVLKERQKRLEQGVQLINQARKKRGMSDIQAVVLDPKDVALFVFSQEEAQRTNPYSGWVDVKSAEELEGATLIMLKDEQAGVAIKQDGDIVALHKASSVKHKDVGPTLILLARLMGGLKMDNYGDVLANMYEMAGFQVVNQIPFNPDYVNDSLLLEKAPNVYTMVIRKRFGKLCA